MKRLFSIVPFFVLFAIVGLAFIAVPTEAKPVAGPGEKVLLVPTPTATSFAQPYRLDSVNQDGGVPVRHYIYGPTYLWTMFPNDNYIDKELKIWSVSGVLNEVVQGLLNWNNYRPAGVEIAEMVAQGYEKVTVYNSNCPGLPPAGTLGCFVPSIWDAGYMSTFNIRVWMKADIYIRPLCCGQTWGANAKLATVTHELGHALTGMNDQGIVINGNWTCNGVVTSMMDAFTLDVNGVINHCDLASPNLADKNMWYDYHNKGQYNVASTNVFSGGRFESTWVDRAWNDYYMQALWYWGDSFSGQFTYFAETNPIGNNGSAYYVPGAESRRLTADLYVNSYNIHNKWIKVCARPVFNYTAPPSNMGVQFCTIPLYYGY